MSYARDLGDAASKINDFAPPGMVMPFAGTTAPSGWLACEGQAVSRTLYPALFAAIGTTWGAGDSSTTFNVPDFRGAFLRGTGSHGTQNMANGSDFAGPSVGSFEDDQFQDFQIGGLGAGGATYYGTLAGSVNTRTQGVSTSGEDFPRYNGANSGSTNRLTALTDSTNGNPRKGDETRPFNAGILYCIRALGSLDTATEDGQSSGGGGGNSGGGGGGGNATPADSNVNLKDSEGYMVKNSNNEAVTTDSLDDSTADINRKLGTL